jgi:hypothetical protein
VADLVRATNARLREVDRCRPTSQRGFIIFVLRKVILLGEVAAHLL